MAYDRKDYFIDHLYYEIWMLGETYTRLHLANEPITDRVVANALVESFCIHVRALIEFFLKGHADKYTNKRYGHKKTRYEKETKLLNTQIAHLIFDGRTGEDSGKIGAPQRQRMYDLLKEDINAFKLDLRAECLEWKELPDLPTDSGLTVPVTPHGASSAPTGTTVNFDGPGQVTSGPPDLLTFSSVPAKPAST